MREKNDSRRRFLIGAASTTAYACVRGSVTAGQSAPARRFIIDSHHHFDPAPGYLDRLVRIYGPRNAMACVLTRFP
ncbi:MAG: hypothetical protein RIR86_1257, partial [Acidobacteriota bacterium]